MNEIEIKKDYMSIKCFLDEDSITGIISSMIIEYFVNKYNFDMDSQKGLEEFLYQNEFYTMLSKVFSDCNEYSEQIYKLDSEYKIKQLENIIDRIDNSNKKD